MQEIVAEAPYSEMFKYATDLRSMTQARGSFKMEFARYEEVPESIAKKIIEEHGGKIWANSVEGEGTTISFVLRKYKECVTYE